MTTSPHTRVAAAAAVCLSLAAPSAALAATAADTSGGAGIGAGPPATAATTPTATTTDTGGTATAGTGASGSPSLQAVPLGGPVSAAGDGFTLTTSADGTFAKALSFNGSAPASDAGQVLEIQRRAGGGSWLNTAHATVAGGGDFSVAWRANRSGRFSFRATLQDAVQPAEAPRAATAAPLPASPALAVTIYQNAVATIYGPGLYGRRTACGERLRPGTLGVASRTLKCGTKVSIAYDGVTITVPVIDRGPYAHLAKWDLTEATAAALGDPETEIVGAAVL